MIGIGQSTRVMVATRPVDFRKGPDALAALVATEYGGDPYSGVIYVFRAKRADRIGLVTVLRRSPDRFKLGSGDQRDDEV
ncbi:transposase [Novosphingobium sp. SG751A]|uniref:IS66 family insertion sequence element accessory protein TnpB n=1 Tax=Novosphingobium sp. SG751A TaxID=2587000 RepID=UPI001554C4CE|nr:IS66 family insertion sequence element accessory protein TnpB [Novosphingobium sp. SG751A]NOW44973.1 transposase [Novosphingobium sp. SG751A]